MGGWGYQLERSRAGTALALYTLGGSLPLLLFIIIAGGYSRVGLHGAGAGAMGGYGALALQDLAAAGAISSVLIGVSLAGAVGVAGLCCQSLDLKVLIAYTSVGHMALVVLGVSLHTSLGAGVGCLVLLSHGFRSSLGFYLAFILYINTGSRRVVLNKATLGASGLLVGL